MGNYQVDKNGFYGEFGGAYVPEILYKCVKDLQDAYLPIIKKWNWREFIGVRMLWGDLSDKNNPMLPENAGNSRLMYFPEGANVMDPKKPYAEIVVGIHNIFRFFNAEYVRRLNYTELPSSPRWGMRYVISLHF